jgi:hypothetical protein
MSARARFRARLDADPRRWVLAIVAAEGILAPLLKLSEKREFFFSKSFGAPILALMLATMPAFAVAAMFVHGRLLYWTGRPLGGTARPHEIHAAWAWSQLPFVLTAWPLLLELPLRVAAADADPVPASLQRAIALAVAAAQPVAWIATIAALAGAVRWVSFLAEAQRFSTWRAIANQLLAGVLLVGLLVAGIGLGTALVPKSNAMVYGAFGSALILVAVGLPVLIGRMWAGRARAA